MSLLLDALQRSQNKSKAQASVPTDLPPLDVTPLDAPLPDAPKQAQDSPSLELTLDPICDAPPEPARSPEHLAEPVATPAPVTVTQAPPSVPAEPPAPTEPLKPSASPQPSASFTAGTTAGQATAAAASPAPSVPAMPLGTGGEPRSQVTAREAAQAMLGELLAYVRQGDVQAVHSLRRGVAEALEIVARGDRKSSRVVGRKVGDLQLPHDVHMGLIVRGLPDKSDVAETPLREPEVIIPRSTTVIESNDHVVFFLPHKRLVLDVEKLFRVSATFF